MKQLTVPLAFLAAFIISVFFILPIIDLARKRRLFDDNNHLKRHIEKVCSLGGVAIFSSFWITFSLFGEEMINSNYRFLFAGSFMLFLVGVKDDLVGVTAINRLIVQIGVAILLFFSGLGIEEIPGIEGTLPAWLGCLLTVLLMGAIVNAFNFIDGINGLSSGLAFIGALAFAWVFYQANAQEEVLFSLALAGSILGFWFFNFGTAKIFMGDNGSTFIGILLSFLTISYLQGYSQSKISGEISPYIVGAILLIPMADMIKVIVGRLVRGISPFKGDHTHIHHVLKKIGFGHRTICVLLYGWSIFIIVISIFLLPQDFFLAHISLFLIAGLPYGAVVLSNKMTKENKQPTYKSSRTRELT